MGIKHTTGGLSLDYSISLIIHLEVSSGVKLQVFHVGPIEILVAYRIIEPLRIPVSKPS